MPLNKALPLCCCLQSIVTLLVPQDYLVDTCNDTLFLPKLQTPLHQGRLIYAWAGMYTSVCVPLIPHITSMLTKLPTIPLYLNHSWPLTS